MVATKRLTIYNPPSVLALHLKRFQYAGMMGAMPFGGKINKPIEFAQKLDLKPFMSNKSVRDIYTSMVIVVFT